jgi:hypothetical protein
MSRPILLCVLLLISFSSAQAADDRPPTDVEVYEWSVWVGTPSQTSLNAARIYRNAMPGPAGTIRPKVEGPALDRKFAVSPVSVAQFFGDPTDDVDVDLRVKKGKILSHWPQATERSDGLRWFKSNLLGTAPPDLAPGYIPGGHPFLQLREVPGALFLKHESRVERFLAYDTELSVPIPVKLRGGPEEYTLQNVTAFDLRDVAVIVPVSGGGYRIGWLDTLPSAVPADTQSKPDKAKPKDKDKPSPDAVFAEAETAGDSKPKDEAKAKPIPPEADANIRARVDQALNRPVTIHADSTPRAEVLALIAGQARFRYEIDDVTLAKAKVDLGKPMALEGVGLAARDALAEVIGPVGLSYRVTADGSLFLTTAARLAAEADKQTIPDGPPVKLTLSQPLLPADPSFREMTRDAYSRRLAALGMRKEAITSYLDLYAPVLFQPKGLIVLAHLSPEAIDEIVQLDVFPSPKTLVRSALIVSHGLDPRLADQARLLVQKLSDPSPQARDEAESSLFDMGPVAVPVLEDALRDKDIEVVFRAERLLLRMNRQVP